MDKTECTLLLLSEYKDDLQGKFKPCSQDQKRKILLQLRIWAALPSNPPLALIDSSKICETLIHYSITEGCDDKMMLDILWVLSNMCSGNSDFVQNIVAFNGCETMIEYLRSPILEIIEQW